MLEGKVILTEIGILKEMWIFANIDTKENVGTGIENTLGDKDTPSRLFSS